MSGEVLNLTTVWLPERQFDDAEHDRLPVGFLVNIAASRAMTTAHRVLRKQVVVAQERLRSG
jgi:hypothetical protein